MPHGMTSNVLLRVIYTILLRNAIADLLQTIFKHFIQSCDLDPLPIWLKKKCIDLHHQLIIAITNRLLAEKDDAIQNQMQ